MSAGADEIARRLAPAVETLPTGCRVLVTGGSGFIGTNLVEALRRRAVTANVDIAHPRDTRQREYWTQLDVRDCARLTEFVRDFRPDVVLHAAARTDLDGRRLEDYATNTVGTDAVLEALDQCGFAGMAVFFSSMLTNRPGATSAGLGEGHPDTWYGASKLQMEDRVRAARLTYRHVVVRPTSIWGPWFAEPYRAFFQMVIRGRYFHSGSHQATKTFGFVGNTVHQTLALVARNITQASPVYLGDEPPVAIADWANEIAAATGSAAPRRLPEAAGRLAARAGDLIEQFGIRAPLTSRRLMNLKRDNIVDLGPIRALSPAVPFSRAEGTTLTLQWLAHAPGAPRFSLPATGDAPAREPAAGAKQRAP